MATEKEDVSPRRPLIGSAAADMDETENMIRLIRQFIEASACHCRPGINCWHCVFEFNLRHWEVQNQQR